MFQQRPKRRRSLAAPAGVQFTSDTAFAGGSKDDVISPRMKLGSSSIACDADVLGAGTEQATAGATSAERPVLIPTWLILLLPIVIFVAQMLLGTSLYFASAVYLFNSLSLLIPNILGGLRNLAALLALVFCVKLVVLSQILKVLFLQPADSNLYQPTVSITIVVVSVFAVLTSAICARFLIRPRSLFSSSQRPRDLTLIALACFIVGGGCFAILYTGGSTDEKVGGIYGPIKMMLVPALNMMIIAATARAILRSDRRRSIDWLVILIAGAAVTIGIFSFSKQKMLMPFLIYLLTCWCFYYRIKFSTILSMLFVGVFAVFVISPVVNAFRDHSVPLEQRIVLILETITNLTSDERILREAREKSHTIDHLVVKHYYGPSMGILDRFTMTHVDQVAEGVSVHGTIGFKTLAHGLSMALPRSLNPGKPTEGPATIIRYHIDRRAAVSSSQYSYGIVGDGYASFGYIGVYMYTFVFTLILFCVINTLCAKFSNNIWAAFLFMDWHHTMVEHTSGALLVDLTHGMIITFFFYFAINMMISFFNNRFFAGASTKTQPLVVGRIKDSL